MNQVAGPFVPHHQPGQFGFGAGTAAAYPYQAPASSSSSYHGGFGGYTGNATPQQQQTHSSQAFAGAGYHNGGHGAIASPGKIMQAQQFAGQYPYTTAPFSQSVPAQAPSAPAQPAQLPQQHQALRQSQSASPQQRQSPHAASQPAQQTPPQKYPMAAPPLPQSPASQQQAAGQNASPSPNTPQSPGSQSREQHRIALLLDINFEMLQEVSRLQAEGKGGALSPHQQAQLKQAGQPSDLASEDYIQVMRRVQANLAYLMPKAQNEPQKTPKGPALMTPPPHMTQLQPKYDQLKELFPDWQGLEHRLSQSTNSPRPNGPAANGMTTPAAASPAQA